MAGADNHHSAEKSSAAAAAAAAIAASHTQNSGSDSITPVATAGDSSAEQQLQQKSDQWACGENVEERYCLLEDPDTRQQHLLCETHYFERTNMICAKCKEPLDSTYVHAMGRKYHPDHFTCTACPTVFGPEGTYYEHDGEAFCLYHYTYLVAKKCAGCQQPIMKLFLQMSHRGAEEHWHPECYMIYKFWNVRICPSMYAGGRGRVNKQLLKSQNAVSEQQIYQIWTVLSSFEESTAACISDMLLQVSGGRYLEGLRQAERFIMHVDVLFASIDDLEDELSHFDDSTGLQHTREPKLLCKKIVSFFSVLSHTQSNESNGLTQELLSLVTSLAHYLKVLTRVALKGALKAQTEYKCPSSIKALLSKLTETSDRQKWALFRLSYHETDVASDLCTACHSPVETECIEHMRKRKRWHLYCFACTSCNSEIQHVYPQSAYDESAGVLFCPSCAQSQNVVPGGFKFVSQLEQYSFLMRVALKRLYGLLKMKNAVENPGMSRTKDGAVGELGPKSLPAPKMAGGIAGQTPTAGSAADTPTSSTDADSKAFDAALARLDRLELQSSDLELRTVRSESPGQPSDLAASEITHGSRAAESNAQLQKPSASSSEAMNAVTKAAMKTAKNDGDIMVQVLDAPSEPLPPHVLADRRKPRVAHTPVHTMKARMENRGRASGEDPGSPISLYPPEYPQVPPMQRRPGQIATGAHSPYGLGKNGGAHVPPSLSSRPTKMPHLSDDNDSARAETAAMVAATTMNDAEAVSASKVRSMLSRPHTMRFVSDLNTAELFCAKHVAVSRLTALLGGQGEVSQADLVALIGSTKKGTAAGMWSRLKTNLMKKDGGAGGGGSGGSGSGGKDRMRNATFGVPLETLMERQSVETELGAHGKQKLHVPQFFEVMLTTLSSMDLAVEGIFRKNGNIRRLREVTDAVDKDFSRVDLKKDAPVQIAALLKKFLRELPDPLIPFRMRRLFLSIAGISTQRDRMEAFRYAIVLMPQANRDMLNVLMTFLTWVATFSHVSEQTGSKMDIMNLATVITPNILYADVKEPTRGDRDDTFSFEACNVVQQFMEAGESLWMLSDAVIAFLRDNSPELVEGSSELNTKELLRRCERQTYRQQPGDAAAAAAGGDGAAVPSHAPPDAVET
ncbi:Rho-type GTPase activating protein Rga1 [Coemansia sp. RSA 1939]|nr:Rho-type GTPase activating protein Rga1 [Coemansia sp. RSA 1939]